MTRNWLDMSAGDFYTDGTQLDLLGGIGGDGYGTLDLLAAVDEAEAAPRAQVPSVSVSVSVSVPWVVESPLFGDEQLVIGAA